MDPPRGVFAVEVPRQRGVRQCGIGVVLARLAPAINSMGQNARLEQRLKTVADSQHEFVRREKPLDGIAQMTAKLTGENNARSDVVAVTEATGYAEDLVLIEQLGLFDQPEEMDAIGATATHVERVRGLHVTVRAGSTQYTHSGSSQLGSSHVSVGPSSPENVNRQRGGMIASSASLREQRGRLSSLVQS